MLKLVSFVAVLGVVAADASAQERRGLEMPADMPRIVTPPPDAAGAPPGLTRMLGTPIDAAQSTMIATTGAPPSRFRPATVDFYNNLTHSTWTQLREGRFPARPGGERLANENRWAMPPALGIVVQTPIGTPDGGGSAPAFIGLNAGPAVDPYGGATGMAVNARVRVPFGR